MFGGGRSPWARSSVLQAAAEPAAGVTPSSENGMCAVQRQDG